jgi:hypothetical protein
VDVKKSTVKDQLDSKKHKVNNGRAEKHSKIVTSLESFVEKNAPTVQSPHGVPTPVLSHRAGLLRGALAAGISVNALFHPQFRPFIEVHKALPNKPDALYAVTSLVNTFACEEVANMIQGADVSVIFDGTPRIHECVVVLVRFFKGWELKQLALRVRLLRKAPNAPTVAALVNTSLHEAHINPQQVISLQYDSASENVAANADLSRIYPNVTGIPCLSHALNNTGSSLNIPLAISFVDSMSALVSSSFAAHHLFVEHIGSNVSFSRTRWYSWLESAKTLVENFGNIEQFFNK